MSKHQEEQDILLESYTKLERFVNDNKNVVTYGLVAIALLIIGGVYLFKTVIPNRNAKAQDAITMAEFYFGVDSFSIALNGDPVKGVEGFSSVSKKYSFTHSANIAKLYAGICEHQLGNNDGAIKYLKSYSPKADIFKAVQQNVLGDCYMDKGDTKAGLSAYASAAHASKNEAMAPMLLLKTGMAYESTGDNKKALEFYKQLKSDFPKSDEARDADRYIARVGG